MKNTVEKLEERVKALEIKIRTFVPADPIVCPAKPQQASKPTQEKADDEDVDLFGSDSEASGQK